MFMLEWFSSGGGSHQAETQTTARPIQLQKVKEAWRGAGLNKTTISVTMATGELKLIHTLKQRAPTANILPINMQTRPIFSCGWAA